MRQRQGDFQPGGPLIGTDLSRPTAGQRFADGLQAVLPPPEERRNVRTEVGAARARGARDQMGPLGLLRSASADDLPEEMS